MHAFVTLLKETALIWRLSDLIAALAYLAVALTLVTAAGAHPLAALAAGYLPCALLLAALERIGAWNPVLLDARRKA
jgi:hypothetical protein